MRLVVNGEPADATDGATVAELLGTLGVAAPAGIAVAVNGEVVPRGSWLRATLAAGDRVELLGAAQGG